VVGLANATLHDLNHAPECASQGSCYRWWICRYIADVSLQRRVVCKSTRLKVSITVYYLLHSGLATAYHLVRGGAAVTVFDEKPVGQGGASAVAAGMLHPLTPRGKLIWRGAEGLAAANQLIEVL
jgi:FAD dependent oxidoreductase